MKGILKDNLMAFTDETGEDAVTIFFEERNGIWQVTSVVADPAKRGRGLSTRAMDIFLEKAIEKNKKIYPICPFAKHWVEKNQNHSAHFASESEIK